MSKISTILILLCTGMFTGCASVTMSTADSRFKDKYGNYEYCQLEAVKQTQDNSCGSACMASVLNYWGIDVNENQILTEYPKLSNQGYSILELKSIAIDKGIEAYVISMKDDYNQQIKGQLLKGRPVICAVQFPRALYFGYDIPIYGQIYRNILWKLGPRKNHYIVVFGVNDKNSFLVMDPAYGLISFDEDNFYLCWEKMNYAALLCAGK